MSERMIGVFQFEGPTFEEFQKIVCALLKAQCGKLEIKEDPRELQPEYARWQIIMTSKEQKQHG